MHVSRDVWAQESPAIRISHLELVHMHRAPKVPHEHRIPGHSGCMGIQWDPTSAQGKSVRHDSENHKGLRLPIKSKLAFKAKRRQCYCKKQEHLRKSALSFLMLLLWICQPLLQMTWWLHIQVKCSYVHLKLALHNLIASKINSNN